ncbi:hypothetical protein TRP8649_00623 [Pelagimonas phthalicica]|uniref:MORN repeat variant n=1 Tax=Pelagimonas phthalicica TaxID=1037362 RepID=A0A238J731_9RHOB|nr:hypothetical protein [Pelagimonas phthalicica]TDS94933.1 hypothetical protein CLV87_1450 [Pelagimonas phthalicica]SMX26541.1 hypothetical protein TRP8649_00623 [Pelagimonas phthalicica]
MRVTLTFLMLLAAPVWAQSFVLKSGDAAFENAELDQRLRGQVLTFFDDGQSKYYEDGRYSYTYANDGGTAYGYWDINPAGAVCIQFLNEQTRCDMYVKNGDRLILITEEGHRFPVRP